jgi:hypothetical protein
LQELEKMDFVCSIDREQEKMKHRVEEAFRQDPQLFIEYFKVEPERQQDLFDMVKVGGGQSREVHNQIISFSNIQVMEPSKSSNVSIEVIKETDSLEILRKIERKPSIYENAIPRKNVNVRTIDITLNEEEE